jgi:hypothetical protein
LPGSTCGGLTGAVTFAAAVTICVVITGSTGGVAGLAGVLVGHAWGVKTDPW